MTSTSPAPVTVPPAERSDLRTFGYLNGVMFQGAFSDNVFKNLIVFLGLGLAGGYAAESGKSVESVGNTLTAVAGIVFILPYMIVPTFAGSLADKFSKTKVTRWTKLLEVVAMLVAVVTLGFGLYWPAMAVLFVMGMQSALFSPAKYGILPELVPPHRNGWANGILQGATFVAILLGTAAAGWLFEQFEDNLMIPSVGLVVLALVGWALSLQMSVTPPGNPQLRIRVNPWPEFRRGLAEIRAHDGMTQAIAGLMVWWMVGSMLLTVVPTVGKELLKLTETQVGLAMLPISVGLGVGSMIAARMSRRYVELGLIPAGSIGMFLSCAVLCWLLLQPAPNHWWTAALLGVTGIFAGVIVVPLQSYLITEADNDSRGVVWACQNFLTAFGMIGGAGLVIAMTNILAFQTGQIFLSAGILMLAMSIFICWRMPLVPLRFLIRFVFGAFYRIRVVGTENIPRKGGALLVCNHQSFLDGILMSATSSRPVRFMMSDEYYNKWWIWPFAKMTGTIPISSTMKAADIIRSLRHANDLIRGGAIICIYAEGQITRHGHLLPFRRGYERIMRDTGCPVIPVAIDGLWDSNWSMKGGRIWRAPWPRFHRRPINVAMGTPLPDDMPVHVLRAAVQELLVDAFGLRREDYRNLQEAALRSLRTRPWEPIFVDPLAEGWVSRGKLLAAAVLLTFRLKDVWKNEEHIGLLLPPGVGCAALNLGITIASRVPVNLNYTMSPEIQAQVVENAGIRTILTSRLFIEKLAERVDLRPWLNGEMDSAFKHCKVIYIEDVRKEIGALDRIVALLKGLFMPAGMLQRHLGAEKVSTLDDVATLIYSSGSTGIPKGVMLTHWNVLSNSLGADQIIPTMAVTNFLGALPLFHSFGYLATLWLPMIRGYRTTFFPNPLDARGVGFMVEKYRVTILLATPTFLSGYVRRVEPAQFGSLLYVLTGAEKLRSTLADEFEQRFGLRPVEAYGATETSPAVSINTDNVRRPGVFQVGNKEGTIGHPIPGTCVRVVNADTMELLPFGEAGMLLVRGHNVMKGYYRDPEKTASVMRDGWYITGDIARVDEDGFLQITDRLSRFSKIGGEMVPHLKVEEALHEVIGAQDPVFAVIGVPDEKKGERLLVLYTNSEEEAKTAAEKLAASGLLPNLWVPKFADFYRIEAIPVLGTGKTDLRALKALAAEVQKR